MQLNIRNKSDNICSKSLKVLLLPFGGVRRWFRSMCGARSTAAHPPAHRIGCRGPARKCSWNRPWRRSFPWGPRKIPRIGRCRCGYPCPPSPSNMAVPVELRTWRTKGKTTLQYIVLHMIWCYAGKQYDVLSVWFELCNENWFFLKNYKQVCRLHRESSNLFSHGDVFPSDVFHVLTY